MWYCPLIIVLILVLQVSRLRSKAHLLFLQLVPVFLVS